MSRKAKLVSMGDFKLKVSSLFDEDNEIDIDLILDNATLEKDLSKIQFDWENFAWDGKENENTGFKTLSNGLPVLFCYAGGDWEYPVYFIIYFDGKKLRGYIPEDGNSFDKEYRCAFGSQQETELFNKRFGDLDYGTPEYENAMSSITIPEDIEGNIEDFEKMNEDIINRIKIN